jgi:AraC-like DNA-binding protein
MTDMVLSQEQAAEYRRLKIADRRRARRRELRRAGDGTMGAMQRMAAYVPMHAAAGQVTLAQVAAHHATAARMLDEAVIRLVQDQGWSWAQIAAELGVTRQAAQQRFGHLVKTTRRRGAQPAALR